MQPAPAAPPRPISTLDTQARLVGLGLVVVVVVAGAVSLAVGDRVTGVVTLAAAAVWLAVPAVPAVRTFRWSSETVIARPPQDVLDLFADPERALSYEEAGRYNPDEPRHGSLGVQVLERSDGTVRYRQLVSTGRGRPLTAEMLRTVDRAAGVVRSRMTTMNRGAGDVIRVAGVPGGSRVTYSTEIRYPYLTSLAGAWLAHGRFERQAAGRQAGVLARIKTDLETSSAS